MNPQYSPENIPNELRKSQNAEQAYDQLFANQGPEPISQHVIAVRHAENDPRLENDRNQPLTAEGEKQAARLGGEIVDFYLAHENAYPGGILIIRSNKTRVKQTSEICENILAKYEIANEAIENSAIREMEQGDMIIKGHENPQDIYPPLHNAWVAFQNELSQGNIHYYFGDSIEQESGNFKYKELLDYFNIFGESEADFTLRLYKFLIETFSLSTDRLLIIFTHQGILSRIQRICNLATKINQHPTNYEDINFIAEEYQAERIPTGHGTGVILSGYNYQQIAVLLKKEYDKLVAEINQLNREMDL